VDRRHPIKKLDRAFAYEFEQEHPSNMDYRYQRTHTRHHYSITYRGGFLVPANAETHIWIKTMQMRVTNLLAYPD
jgi:hypothetical protein